jgi:chemotaxis protein MotB
VRRLVFFSLLLALPTSGCVAKIRLDRCVADAARAADDARTLQRADAARLQEIAQQLAYTQGAVQERDARLNDLSTSGHNVQAELDQATAINQQLRGELQRLGTDVDKMLAERGTLSQALDSARLRLDELRRAQAVAEERAHVFRDFQERFRPLIEAGQIRIDSRRGELVMNIQGVLLFDEGRSDLRTAGKGSLMEIAHALETTSPGSGSRRFLVTANTDATDGNDPERSGAHRPRAAPSPWALTAARAVSVVEYLVSLGVPATSLTAAAAGSFDPLVTGVGPEDRATNRRIEIALLPSADSPPPPVSGRTP